MDNVNEIIRNLKLPRDLKIRIFNYYEYKWVRTKGLDISWFLDDLSPNFRADVSLCLHREMVQGVPVFHDIAPDFLVVCNGLYCWLCPFCFKKGGVNENS